MKKIDPYIYAGLNVHKENARSINLIIARRCGVTVQQLEGRSRKQPIATARQLAMHFIRDKNPTLSLASIGEMFGRDHATVIHAIKTVKNLEETDPDFRELFRSIERQLQDTVKGNLNTIQSKKTISSMYEKSTRKSKILT